MHIPALLEFLEGLSENNNRPWFLHNKPAYDILREEFTQLVAEVIEGTARFDPRVAAVDPKKALFRIYRDVRFSKNKDPYKTQFSAFIAPRKDHKADPGYYFQITHEGKLGLGGGIYSPEPPTLRAVREALAQDSAAFRKVLKHKEFAATYGGLMEEDKLTRPPKGFAPDLELIEPIKNRHFFAWTEINLKTARPKDLAGTIVTHFAAAKPLCDWLGRTSKAA